MAREDRGCSLLLGVKSVSTQKKGKNNNETETPNNLIAMKVSMLIDRFDIGRQVASYTQVKSEDAI